MRPVHWDMIMVMLAAVQGALLFMAPSVPLIAIAMWWNSNTISHNFIHRPFFQSRWANSAFALCLTVLLGYPQSLWRDRHLAHHAGSAAVLRVTRGLAVQALAILTLWIALAVVVPQFFFWLYVPGWIVGLALCAIQGHYEHSGGTTSHYGRLYNILCFNDGYHVEHHAWPGLHWTRLRDHQLHERASDWPAPLRWLESLSVPSLLEAMERIVFRSPRLERWVLDVHRQAFERVLPHVPRAARIAIVGGGLFPRTALILRELLPDADLTIIDANKEHLHTAEAYVSGVVFVHAEFNGQVDRAFDVVVIPLSLRGDRKAVWRYPPAPAVTFHDWLWRRREHSTLISLALLKRLNVTLR